MDSINAGEDGAIVAINRKAFSKILECKMYEQKNMSRDWTNLDTFVNKG